MHPLRSRCAGNRATCKSTGAPPNQVLFAPRLALRRRVKREPSCALSFSIRPVLGCVSLDEKARTGMRISPPPEPPGASFSFGYEQRPDGNHSNIAARPIAPCLLGTASRNCGEKRKELNLGVWRGPRGPISGSPGSEFWIDWR